MQSQSALPSRATGAQTYPYQLPPLAYSYAALEPYIDAETMRLHHDKHHLAYIDKLNAALKDHPQFHHMSIEELLSGIDRVPEQIREDVRNQGGGHANHQFFWKILKRNDGAEPSGALLAAINENFNSFDDFKRRFKEAGEKHFGSGWVFLVRDGQSGRLEVITRPNQDSVLMIHKGGLLCCDLWEHAYYLKYQNRRPEYLEAFWNVAAWDAVAERYEAMRAGRPPR